MTTRFKTLYLSIILLLSAFPYRTFSQSPIKVACVGNSITYGTGIEDREHDSYPAQLQHLLGSTYQVGNFGRPGATLLAKGHRPYIKQPEYEEAKAFCPDIVVFHLGINDTDPRNWPNYRDYFVSDYLELIDSFRKINPDVRCLVARMTPIADRHPRFISGTKQWHQLIQTAIETVAEISGAELIDFFQVLYPFPWMLPDAIHPNIEGAGILAHTVYSSITGDYGGLQLSALYSDNMVLQRDEKITLQGIANAGDKVSVKFGKQKRTAYATNQGRWQVTLGPLKAGDHYQLEIEAGKQRKVFRNVAVGEVWLCSGQSNMEFTLNQCNTAQDALQQESHSSIRLYDMKARWRTDHVCWPQSSIDSINHLDYFKPTVWEQCTSQKASQFSAVAYYFARNLQDSLQVPVGVICNAVGGAPVESWIDRNTLETNFPAILKDWTNNDFVMPWVRQRALMNLKNSTFAFKRHPYEPCYLFESGIIPLQEYPIKGVIWHQGESNAHNMEAFEKLFELFVQSWRGYWHNPTLPFYYVQLSSLDRPSWTWFRDSQRRMMDKIPYCGMAVSSDKGDSLDVHPRDKFPIGYRLARWALNKTYHLDVTPSGPLFNSAVAKGKYVDVFFTYGDGLHATDGEIQGFEIAEYDGIYYPAIAVVKNNQIRLSSEKVKRPRYVRYGWKPFTRANLVNEDELPASTFRSEVH